MKALQQIIRRVAENPSRAWALATLVQAEGSTYRKPGARLLADSDGGTLGVLSGGCLEEEIPEAGEDGNLITRIGRSLEAREVCRVRTCFEGDTLGSELLTFDVLIAERRGVLIATVP